MLRGNENSVGHQQRHRHYHQTKKRPDLAYLLLDYSICRSAIGQGAAAIA